MTDWVKKQVESVPLSVELDILLDLKEIIKKNDLTIVGLFEDENAPLYQEFIKAGEEEICVRIKRESLYMLFAEQLRDVHKFSASLFEQRCFSPCMN